MKLLSMECSATPCSVALTEEGKILANAFSNVKLTHSETLMPMVESVLHSALCSVNDIDALAVSVGPGSFTGIRIGISAVKGLAQAKKLPCVPVSTLRAMAENYSDTDCLVCAVMDARCNQVYNALFENSQKGITRLCEDRAIAIDGLVPQIKDLSKAYGKIIIMGDGAQLFYPFVKEISGVCLADPQRRFQNAVGVGAVAANSLLQGEYKSVSELQPVYLRLPQAERELKRKEENKNENCNRL